MALAEAESAKVGWGAAAKSAGDATIAIPQQVHRAARDRAPAAARLRDGRSWLALATVAISALRNWSALAAVAPRSGRAWLVVAMIAAILVNALLIAEIGWRLGNRPVVESISSTVPPGSAAAVAPSVLSTSKAVVQPESTTISAPPQNPVASANAVDRGDADARAGLDRVQGNAPATQAQDNTPIRQDYRTSAAGQYETGEGNVFAQIALRRLQGNAPAAQTQDYRTSAAGQYETGERYFYGREVKQDYGQAKAWYQKAADQGYSDAQFEFGPPL
jgi:Sel1 repeat